MSLTSGQAMREAVLSRDLVEAASVWMIKVGDECHARVAATVGPTNAVPVNGRLASSCTGGYPSACFKMQLKACVAFEAGAENISCITRASAERKAECDMRGLFTHSDR